MVGPGRSTETQDLPKARRRLSQAQRAIAWILALATAVFVISYVTSPKDAPTGDRSDLAGRGAMQEHAGP
ncbi:hypothetical protein [Phenylobacterium sp.]|uniref:hypothetical protein n=1 Tax=Phenylobacterium sp. TaxID=1871053 RepID=UPI00289E26FC|nr:hypothetical protein [Phenylobacterium sp.]